MALARSVVNLSALRAAATGSTSSSSLARGVAAFSTSSELRLKESANKDNIDFDKHKQDSLQKLKKGQGHWKPELASDSEEAVKADRAGSRREDTAQLQERTKRAAEETARSGTSMNDGM